MHRARTGNRQADRQEAVVVLAQKVAKLLFDSLEQVVLVGRTPRIDVARFPPKDIKRSVVGLDVSGIVHGDEHAPLRPSLPDVSPLDVTRKYDRRLLAKNLAFVDMTQGQY